MGSVSHRCFPPHFRATAFDRKCVVQHAELLFGERRGCRALASGDLAGCGHNCGAYGDASVTLLANRTPRRKSRAAAGIVSNLARFRPWADLQIIV